MNDYMNAPLIFLAGAKPRPSEDGSMVMVSNIAPGRAEPDDTRKSFCRRVLSGVGVLRFVALAAEVLTNGNLSTPQTLGGD
jgi:hypothetical protein